MITPFQSKAVDCAEELKVVFVELMKVRESLNSVERKLTNAYHKLLEGEARCEFTLENGYRCYELAKFEATGLKCCEEHARRRG